jgi:hypothetical protein
LGLRGTRWQGSGEGYITRNFITKHSPGDQIENEVGTACSTYRGNDIYRIW